MSYEECIETKITLWSCIYTYKMESKENIKEKKSFRFLFGYVKNTASTSGKLSWA